MLCMATIELNFIDLTFHVNPNMKCIQLVAIRKVEPYFIKYYDRFHCRLIHAFIVFLFKGLKLNL